MTEYKRALETIESIKQATTQLKDVARAEADINTSKQLLDSMQDDVVPSFRTKVEKLLAKAREKDPDRQIYNEMMCKRIEELAAAAAEALAAFETVVEPIETLYHVALVQRMNGEAYRAALVSSTKELEAREKDARDLLKLNQASDSRAVADVGAANYNDALSRFRERVAREWAEEEARRAEEAAQFAGWQEQRRKDLHGFVQECFTMIPEATRRATWRHLADLLDALRADPSNPGVQRLRNAHPAVLANFGHPFAEPAALDGDAAAAALARAKYAAAERLLAGVGYAPAYSINTLGTTGTGAPGWKIGAHAPWAKHGERLLELREPEADKDPQEWLDWHERLQAIHEAVASTRG
jgi:hypothetical protein